VIHVLDEYNSSGALLRSGLGSGTRLATS
jgi:hypothetical protein